MKKFTLWFSIACIVLLSVFLSIDKVLICTTSKTLDREQLHAYQIPNNYWEDLRGGVDRKFDHELYLRQMRRLNLLKRSKMNVRGSDLEQEWHPEGPGNIGGRFNVIALGSEGGEIMYAGAANGGVFMTEDAGSTWKPIFDFNAFMAVSAITVQDGNIYVGTGDNKIWNNVGNGVYHSSDNGENWKHLGLDEVRHVSDVCVDPSNPSILLVGALSRYSDANNKQKGVFKSEDGGSTWTNTLFKENFIGATDIVMDPTNSKVIYCSMLPFRGGSASLHKSTDGGSNWQKIGNGLPSGISKLGIGIAKTNSNILYAVGVANSSYNVKGVYKSTDGGEYWYELNTGSSVFSQLYGPINNRIGWYFGTIHVNPFDENHVVIPGVNMVHSTDGGNYWTQNVPDWSTYEVHADKHDVQFLNSQTMIIATDGGLYKTNNRGNSWQDIENIPVTQFYDITVSDLLNGKYGGGAQDNGTIIGNAGQINSWSRYFGGDGFKFTPTSAGYDICEWQNGGFYLRYSEGSGQAVSFEQNEKFPWFTPYEFNDDQRDMLVGSNRLIYFDNLPYGRRYLSGNLTRLGPYGLYSPTEYIIELERNPSNPDHVLVGTSDGLVWKGNISGVFGNWKQINDSWGTKSITSVNHSTVDESTYFVSMTGYYNPYNGAEIFKTTDGGQTWTSISGNMPGIGVNDLLLPESGNDHVIFAATDGGVFVTTDGGTNWELMGTNLPTITVSEVELDLNTERLIAGTFARSIWSYDISFLNLDRPFTVGVEESSVSYSVYPNPVENELTVKGVEPNKTGQIFNARGELVREIDSGAGTFNIDCSALPSGVYKINFEGKAVSFVKK